MIKPCKFRIDLRESNCDENNNGAPSPFFRLIRPLALGHFGHPGDSGVAFFVMGIMIYLLSSAGLPGLLMFEASRLFALKPDSKKKQTCEQPSNQNDRERSMMNIAELFKRMTLAFVLTSVPLLGGCGDNTLTWTEEVKLLDGRVIKVTQKNRVEEDMPREFWLTFKLPEFGNQEIVWHGNLMPIVLNIYQNKLYVVGIPATTREFLQYGSPKPPYLAYRYEAGQWQPLPFNEIPVAIYDTNLYFDNMALSRQKYVSLNGNAVMMRDDRYMPYSKRIDPNHVSQ